MISSAFHQIQVLTINDQFLVLKIDGICYRCELVLLSSKFSQASPDALQSIDISPSGYGIGMSWPLLDLDLTINGILSLSEPLAQTA